MDFTIICMSGVGLSAASLVLYKIARPHFSVKVNCWFCSTYFNVDFSHRNSWTCKSCGQYNGFTREGDYNREIPEQCQDPDEQPGSEPIHFAVRDVDSRAASTGSHTGDGFDGNGLCRTCNLNQELKVHQLKNFNPSHPDRYDEEIQEYQQHLERTYRLCRYCEATLHQTLGEQDSWIKPKLLAWKLELSRQSPLSSALNLCKNNRDRDTFQRRMTLILSLVFLFGSWLQIWKPDFVASNFFTDFSLGYRQVVMSFLLVILTAYGLNPWVVIRYSCHQFCVATWILLFFYSISEDSLSLFESSRNLVRSLAALLCLTAAWYSSKRRSNEERCMTSTKIKTRKIFKMRAAHITTPTIDEEEEECSSQKDETLTQDLLSTTSATSTTRKSNKTSSSPLRPPIRAPQFGAFLPNHEIHHGEKTLSFDEQEEELDEQVNPPCDLSVLQIDRSSSSCSQTRSPPFEVRRYDAVNTSGINFSFSESVNSGRPLIKPPRFVYEQPHRVAQSSWVAGGYWHHGRGQTSFNSHPAALPDNLSRSSSQTSGFVSVSHEPVGTENIFSTSGLQQPFGSLAFASLPNSRVNSVCGDRHSVLSEPVYTNNHGQADMSLHSLGNQLAFFDTSRKSWSIRERDTTIPKSRVVRDIDEDSDSSEDRFTQKTFPVKPIAESSPIEKRKIAKSLSPAEESFLEKKIHISCSLYSLLFVVSVSFNIGVLWYLVLA